VLRGCWEVACVPTSSPILRSSSLPYPQGTCKTPFSFLPMILKLFANCSISSPVWMSMRWSRFPPAMISAPFWSFFMDMRQAGLRTKRHRRCIRPLPWRGLCPCLSWFASMFFLRCCGCSVFLYMHLTPLSKPLYGRISPLVIHFFHKACSICVADGVRNCKYPERYLPYMLLCSPGIWQEYYCE